MKNRAHRNSGIERKTVDTKPIIGSAGVPRARNSNTPPPSPIAVAMAIAITASSTVAGSVAPTRLATLRRKWIEVPKSPCTTWPSQIRNCCGNGRSSPISWRLASISAIVAIGGSDMAAGSTGNSRRMQNSNAATKNRMTNEISARRTISSRMAFMPRPCPVLSDPRKPGEAAAWQHQHSRPVHAAREHPAVAVFHVAERFLAHDALHRLQQRDRRALLDGRAHDLLIARDPLGVIRNVEQLADQFADLRAFPGRERQLGIEQ